ncbi:unnamed protein product [Paramecium sonneborni]|uniref:Uncharacterized protein n=1 Tax=Paramecium sonneborni TaxID=65129 RepID=A0A8S1P2V5_9CILI|nr:unnamed protein product [Paramecium sonneborni]
MNLPNQSKNPKRMMKTLFISQPIIFQSKGLSKSDQVIEIGSESTSTKHSAFQSLESQSLQKQMYGIGFNTEKFIRDNQQLEEDKKKKRVLRPGQITPLQTMSQKSSIQNIFQEAENEERKKFIDYTGGPRFENEKQDKLIKYSVVGYQQFLKIHQEKLKQDQKKKKNQNINNGATDESATEEQLPLKTSQFNEKIQQSRKTPKKNRGDQKVFKKRDLVQIMRDTEKRIKQSQKELEEQERKLPQNVRNAITREDRSIKKHEVVKTLWENVNIQVASNCFRQPEETIMARSDQYREKNQIVQALELCKGDDEKNNSRYWYLKLRWYDHKDSRPPFTLLTQKNQQQSDRRFDNRLTNRFVTDTEAERQDQQEQFVLSDIQSNFNAKLVENPFKQVETVISEQKLKSQQLSGSPKSKLYSTQLESMYHQKLKDKPKKKFADCQDYLSIVGESQFQRELRMLKREQIQEFKLAEIPNEEQEVVISTWNKKSLAKSGEQMMF